MRRYIAAAAAALTITVTACSISRQQEVQMGADYAAQINQQLPIVTDPEINRYINVLGDSIAGLTSRADLDWHFYVVDSREVNAFAVPGGFIYVNRGLIERTDNMAQLAGVLGHEIGHVTRRHSVEQMTKAQRTNAGVMIVCTLTDICSSEAARVAINVGGQAVFARFSRAHEAEADSDAVANVVRAGIDPRGVPTFFETLMEERRRQPTVVDKWFGTHPLEESRVAATRRLIQQLDPSIQRGLASDSPAYQSFKARVLALPPPPPPRALPQTP
jgi:beta-barrel assembly-enhancing protease